MFTAEVQKTVANDLLNSTTAILAGVVRLSIVPAAFIRHEFEPSRKQFLRRQFGFRTENRVISVVFSAQFILVLSSIPTKRNGCSKIRFRAGIRTDRRAFFF